METRVEARRRRPAEPRPDLGAALAKVRCILADASFPFDLPSAAPARQARDTLAAQLDDYLIPRLRRIEAPLLAVVGGSTGTGKSTLVNSLVRAPVSRTGVLRPTTRAPLLACHPADGAWFEERSLLAGLARSSRSGERVLQIVLAPLLVAGLALLDAPDIDSVVAANRALAHELLAAGDLWLFVTTATRYADAVPWQVLRGARDRGTVVALVLDRVPPEARAEVSADFARMLRDQQLAEAPMFVIEESTLDPFGLLAESAVAPIKRWLDTVAASTAQRRRVTRRTLLGAVAAVGPRAEMLASAADEQTQSVLFLAGATRTAYAEAMSNVEASLRGGALLRGEVYSRWQELMVGGELSAALRAAAGPRRSRVRATRVGQPVPGRRFQAAVAGAVAALIIEGDVAAAEQIRAHWREHAAGRELLGADEWLGRTWPGFADAAFDLVHSWQAWLRALVRGEAPRMRTRARGYLTASNVLLATIIAIAPAPEAVGPSAGVPAMLPAVLRNRAARSLGERARAELLVRVGDLYSAEVDRHLAAIATVGVDPGLAMRFRAGVAALGSARSAFAALGDAA